MMINPIQGFRIETVSVGDKITDPDSGHVAEVKPNRAIVHFRRGVMFLTIEQQDAMIAEIVRQNAAATGRG